MALRKIALQGEPCLTKVCRPVTEFNGRLHTLLDDLADTLADSGGVGLAAPQVGVLRRMVVIDVGEKRGRELLQLINPEIVETEGSMVNAEGCLSIPGRRGTVERPERVVVHALNRKGQMIEVVGTGFLAMALCHEIDHLDGILYTDKMIEDVTDREDV